MSTPPSSESSTVHPARRRLDELDVLLQRMLELPVNRPPDNLRLPAEPEARESPIDTVTRSGRNSSAEIPRSPVSDELIAPEQPASKPPSHVSEHTPSLPDTPESFGKPEECAKGIENHGAPELFAFAASETPARLSFGSPSSNVSRESPDNRGSSRTYVLLMPLVVANAAFDACTVPLGAPGRWLRGTTGRNALGWSGIVLVSAACAWAVLGWSRWLG